MTRRKAGILISTIVTISACALWLGIQRSQPQETRQTPQTQSETVVLLHGLGRSPASMKKLQKCLEQAGYGVTNWGYSSTRQRIEEHGQRLHEFLAELDAEPAVQRIHIVGHSLGGIVARYALTIKTPAKMGRVVMLAPPNQGSASARKWAPFLGKVIKPLGQLSDDPKSAVNRLSTPSGVDFGVIAAASDGKVDLEATHLRGEADHLVVPGYHTFIMNRPDVCEQVIHFLRHGRFERPDDDAPESEIVKEVEQP